jgi:putative transposase
MAVLGYTSDLTDQQWSAVKGLLPNAKPGGRPRTTDLRDVIDAILYLLKTGCQWRNLPSEFPPWETVYTYFRNWSRDGTVKRIRQRLVKRVRRKEGRRTFPTIAIMDSQSVKTGKVVSKDKGYDGGKHVKGRKRHIAVDILGLPLAVAVTSANTHDKVGGKKVIERMGRWLKEKSPKKIYADGGYMGAPFRKFVRGAIGATLSIKKGIGKKFKGFKPIPKRWVVERSFAWLGDYRRLDKDQERMAFVSHEMISWAFIGIMLRRLFQPV